jgi:hypothetical protein
VWRLRASASVVLRLVLGGVLALPAPIRGRSGPSPRVRGRQAGFRRAWSELPIGSSLTATWLRSIPSDGPARSSRVSSRSPGRGHRVVVRRSCCPSAPPTLSAVGFIVDPFDEHRVLSDVETSGLEPIVVQTRGITIGRPRERTTLRESEDDLDRVAEERLYPVADPLRTQRDAV